MKWVQVQLDEEDHARLKKIADDEKRSITAQALVMLQEQIATRERAKLEAVK